MPNPGLLQQFPQTAEVPINLHAAHLMDSCLMHNVKACITFPLVVHKKDSENCNCACRRSGGRRRRHSLMGKAVSRQYSRVHYPAFPSADPLRDLQRSSKPAEDSPEAKDEMFLENLCKGMDIKGQAGR